MAYLSDNPDDLANSTGPQTSGAEPASLTPTASSGSAVADPTDGSAATAGGTSALQAGGNPAPGNISTGVATPKSTSSGTFNDINAYLNANQAGATNVGNRVAGDVTNTANAANTTIGNNANDFQNQVTQNTNAYNDQLAQAAANNASQYTSNSDLQQMLSGTYSGPTDFGSSQQGANAAAAANNANQLAGLTSTEGGRQELIQNTATNPLSTGGARFDQGLIEGTAPALSNVTGSAASAAPLSGQVTSATNAGNTAATNAAATNANTRQQVLQALQTGQTNLQNTIQGQLQNQVNSDAANNQALQDFLNSGQSLPGGTATINTPVAPGTAKAQGVTLGSGITDGTVPAIPVAAPGSVTMTPGGPGGQPVTPVAAPGSSTPASLLAALGVTPDQYNQLLANAKANGITNLSQYFTPGSDAGLTAGNVATSQQAANMAALAQLQGTSNPLAAAGTTTPGSFDANAVQNAIQNAINSAASTNANIPTGTGTTGSGSGTGTSTAPAAPPAGGDASGTAAPPGQDANAVATTPASAVNAAVATLSAIANPTPVSVTNCLHGSTHHQQRFFQRRHKPNHGLAGAPPTLRVRRSASAWAEANIAAAFSPIKGMSAMSPASADNKSSIRVSPA